MASPELPIRACIIGASGMAHEYARLMTKIPEARLVAIHSRDATRAMNFASQHQIEHHGTNLEVLIRSSGAQAAIICNEPPRHAECALIAAGSGCHFLVEKPICSELAQADHLIRSTENTGLTAGVVSQKRMDLDIRNLKKSVSMHQGHLTIRLIASWHRDDSYYLAGNGWRKDSGDLILNQAIHWLDTLNHLFGHTSSVNILERKYHAHFKVPTYVEATLVYPKASAHVIFDSLAQNIETFCISGHDMQWSLQAPPRPSMIRRLFGPPPVRKELHLDSIRNFFDAIRNKTSIAASLADGRAALELAMKLRQ